MTSHEARAPSSDAAARSASPIPGSAASAGRRRIAAGAERQADHRVRDLVEAEPRRPRPGRRASRRCGGRPGTGRRDGRARRRRPWRSCSPRSAAARIRVRVDGQRLEQPGHARRATPRRRATASNSGALSSWRSRWYASGRPLSSVSDPGQRPDDAGGAATDQLGRVRVLLVGHHRAAGRERVGDAHEPEPRVRPPRDLLGQPAEVDHPERDGRQHLDDEVAVRDGVERVGA